MQAAFPEAMISFDPHADYFTTVPEISIYSAIGVEYGLGQHLESAAALERLLQTTDKPVVLDADALNLIASNKDLLNRIPPRSILTPHPKEFDRIAGESNSMFERLKKAQSLLSNINCV